MRGIYPRRRRCASIERGRTDARAGDRIRDDADAVDVDDHARVADEVEGEALDHRQVLRAASG
jgi:hypothetical protein